MSEASNQAPHFSVAAAQIYDYRLAFDPLNRNLGDFTRFSYDNKVLVATLGTLARYYQDGSIDTDFADNGSFEINDDFSNLTRRIFSVAVQQDGKILIAGNVFGSDHNKGIHNFWLMRLLSDGRIDKSFSNDGVATTEVYSSAVNECYDLVIQPDGKIVLVGYSSVALHGQEFALARYNQDGSLDKQFSGDGKLATGFTADSDDEATSVQLQADGKILVTGVSDWFFAVARFNRDGTLDETFSGDGKLATDFDDRSSKLVLQADGKMLIGGFIKDSQIFELVRYNRDGSLDPSFSDDGTLTTELHDDCLFAVQANGKVLVSGVVDGKLVVMRYNSDGHVDTGFAKAGKFIMSDIGFSADQYSLANRAIYQRVDGKIMVYGLINSYDKAANIVAIRLNADGSLDTSFAKPDLFNEFPDYQEDGDSVAVLNHGLQIYDQELSHQDNYNGAVLTLVRHSGANANDHFTGAYPLEFIHGKAILSGITVGEISSSTGMLHITFNENATQTRVNEVLSSIAYQNTSDAPTKLVFIDWTFNDGNAGAQGTGGALMATGTSQVRILPSDDGYTGNIVFNGRASVGEQLTVHSTLRDPDGIKNIKYHWMLDDVDVSDDLFYTAKASDVGKDLYLKISYVENSGFHRSVDSGAVVIGDNKLGTDGNDIIKGSRGEDILSGFNGNDTLLGSLGDDKLNGGNGDDVLRGGYGNDVLIGGYGRDAFICKVAYLEIPKIMDFSVGIDVIKLSGLHYFPFSPGGLPEDHFAINKPRDADDNIIYNVMSGALFYDRDGTGHSDAFEIVLLAPKLSLSAQDFIVI